MKQTSSWKTCCYESVSRGEGATMLGDALVVPGDDPEVVEGAPGRLLPGHGLVPARSIANTHLVRVGVDKN